MLNSFLLRLIARSSDSLVSFVTGLDATLDKFLAEHDDQVAGFEQEIIDIKADVQARIDEVIADGEAAVKSAEADIAAVVAKGKVLANLKNTLSA